MVVESNATAHVDATRSQVGVLRMPPPAVPLGLSLAKVMPPKGKRGDGAGDAAPEDPAVKLQRSKCKMEDCVARARVCVLRHARVRLCVCVYACVCVCPDAILLSCVCRCKFG